jgi:uncharacterized membrane protein
MTELKWRSFLKSVSYRAICMISLSIVTYIITRDLSRMTYIVLVFQSIQIVIFYIHERIWSRINWGYDKGTLASAFDH